MSSDSDDCSDQDYNPDKDNSEAGSEIESDDDIEDEDEPTSGKQESAAAGKRKATTSGRQSKRAKSDNSKDSDHEEDDNGDVVDEESEKKRADALWADFLGGDAADEEPKPERRRPQTATSTKAETNKDASPPVVEIKKKEPVVVKEIFEYAGEQVVVEKLVTEPPAQTSKSGFPKGRSVAGGGLGSVLGALNKKNKISTLDKTKLDWDRFKDQEGISEDLSTFNRGKDGYLERQDFLQRTDVRQFDIEREIRQTTRSNR